MTANGSFHRSSSDPIDHFVSLVMQWNKVHNLMSSTMNEVDIREHVGDCIIGSQIFDGVAFNSVVDLGSGAGFPGVLLAIKFSDKKVFLVDSVRKKAMFLLFVKNELLLDNVSVVNERVENVSETLFGEKVMLSTRAAFSIDHIDKLIGPIKKCAGIMMWTTPQSSGELEKAFSHHGIQAHKMWDYLLPGSQKSRRVVWFQG